MLINEFSARHSGILTPANIGRAVLRDADVVQDTLSPIVEHQRLEGVAIVSTEEAELVLLSIGRSVLGVATGKDGFIAVDARVQRAGQDIRTRLAAKREPSAMVPSYTLHAIANEPRGNVVKTDQDAVTNFETGVVSQFQPISTVRPSFWTENRLIAYGNQIRGESESLTIRVASGLPLGIFALSQANSVLFTTNVDFLPDVADLKQARTIPTQMELIGG